MDEENKTREQLLKELNTLKVRVAEIDMLEHELMKNKEKLRALEQAVDNMHIGVTISDIEGNILYTNPAEAQMHGYTVDELIGREVRIFAPNGIWNQMTREQAGKLKRMSREGVNVRKDGSTIHVHLISDVVKNAKGEPVALITTSDEITFRKQSAAIQNALLKISNRASAATSLKKLVDDIHNVVGGLIYARNFYLALYDRGSTMVTFPYYVDEFSVTPAPSPLSKGLLEYVITSGEVLYATQDNLEDIIKHDGIEAMDTPFVNWLGIPLANGGQIIGVLVIKSYTDDIQFGEMEQDLLTFVSQQLVAAIVRLGK